MGLFPSYPPLLSARSPRLQTGARGHTVRFPHQRRRNGIRAPRRPQARAGRHGHAWAVTAPSEKQWVQWARARITSGTTVAEGGAGHFDAMAVDVPRLIESRRMGEKDWKEGERDEDGQNRGTRYEM